MTLVAHFKIFLFHTLVLQSPPEGLAFLPRFIAVPRPGLSEGLALMLVSFSADPLRDPAPFAFLLGGGLSERNIKIKTIISEQSVQGSEQLISTHDHLNIDSQKSIRYCFPH